MRFTLAVVALVALLHGLAPAAGAGADALGACETENPSGAPIRIRFLTTQFTFFNNLVTVQNITVEADFGGVTFGPFTIGDVTVGPVFSTVDGGCAVFNDTGLSAQILSAIGFSGTSLDFTKCSFIGSTRPECNAPAGTVHTPLGWADDAITGYAAH